MFKNLDHKIVKLGLVAFVILAMVTGIIAGSVGPVASQEEEVSAWSVRCNEMPEGEVDSNNCEVFQRIVMQETGQRVTEFAIGFPEDKDTARGVIVLPLGILLPDGGQMQIDDGQAFQFKIRYCLNNGCYAFLNMNQTLLQAMRNGSKATLVFKAMDGNEIKLDLSLSGFTKSIEKIS